jgi:hypothetical protein
VETVGLEPGGAAATAQIQHLTILLQLVVVVVAPKVEATEVTVVPVAVAPMEAAVLVSSLIHQVADLEMTVVLVMMMFGTWAAVAAQPKTVKTEMIFQAVVPVAAAMDLMFLLHLRQRLEKMDLSVVVGAVDHMILQPVTLQIKEVWVAAVMAAARLTAMTQTATA